MQDVTSIVLSQIKSYFANHPQPEEISLIGNSLLKLNYLTSNPTINKKIQTHKYYVINNIQQFSFLSQSDSKLQKITYYDEGYLYDQYTQKSIDVQNIHERIFQDAVFGKPFYLNEQWIYIAAPLKKTSKSYFLEGTGVNLHLQDFGQTYQGVTSLQMYVWNTNKNIIKPILTDESITPAFPKFSNLEGSKIIFQGFKKQQFGHGLLYCFNRQIGIYQMDLECQDKQKNIKKISSKENRTNIFPNISSCYNYLIFGSGNGITHCFYLDLVIMKKQSGNWVQHHRIKQILVGYYEDLVTHTININGKAYAFVHSVFKGVLVILKVNLGQGTYERIIQNQIGQNYRIKQITQTGIITGIIQKYSYKSFFYLQNQILKIIPPIKQESISIFQFQTPIHSYYIQPNLDFIHQNFKQRHQNTPLIVIIHGGPHGTAQFQICLLKHCLLKLGYAILLPNFSGSTGFGQKFIQNALGSIGSIDAKQILESIQNLIKSKPNINKNNIHIYGSSFGGYMSALMASKHPQKFRTSIIKNGDSALMSSFWFTDIPEWNIVQSLGKSQLHNLTEMDYAKMFNLSPVSSTNLIPTIQFLGKKDLRCPFRQGIFYDYITKKAGGNIQTYVYQDGQHQLNNTVQMEIDVVIKIINFIQKHKQSQKQSN